VDDVFRGRNIEHVAKDGVKYANILSAVNGMIAALAGYDKAGRVCIIDGTIRGSTVDLVGEDEMPLRSHGIQSNVHELTRATHEALDDLMSPEERFAEYMLPGMNHCLEPARTLIGWALETPEILKRARRIRFLDQLMVGPLVKNYQGAADEPGVSASYLGCHTGLKTMRGSDADLLRFSELARRIHDFIQKRTGAKLIGSLLPERIYTPDDFVAFEVAPEIAAFTGLRPGTPLLAFKHDTTGEEVAVGAVARQHFPPSQTFVSATWGSWFMDRVVPGSGAEVSPIDPQLRGRGIMGQTDLYGRAVKTVLTASGEEYRLLSEELEAKGLEPPEVDEAWLDRIADVIAAARVFAIHGRGPRARFASQFPGSDGRVIDPDGEMPADAMVAYAVADLMGIAPKVRVRDLLGLGDDVPYIVTGGAAAKGAVALLFASAMPNRVYRIIDADGKVVEDAGALSSWMTAVGHLRRTRPEEVDISDLGFSLKEVPKRFDMQKTRTYIDRWCEYAMT
ncbi:MAG: hypothetical protein QF662_02930, partial [Phycisphaerae bacterium]|nr:hypothetical protein [Phycisphaerae bacterium]